MADKDELGETTKVSQLYKDPDKLDGQGQVNYELSQCPAYESTTSEPHPPEVEESNDYEL